MKEINSGRFNLENERVTGVRARRPLSKFSVVEMFSL